MDEVAGPLAGVRAVAPGTGAAADHARRLLACLGAAVGDDPAQADLVVAGLPDAPHSDHDWAASGAEALTGRADGPPLAAPGTPASAVRAALAVVDALTGGTPELPGPEVLSERATTTGLFRRGPHSCGGAFRLLPTADGRRLGLNLARDADFDLLPALTGAAPTADPWCAAAAWAAGTSAHAARERAHLLGIPAAVPPLPGERDKQLTHRHAGGGSSPFRFTRIGERADPPARPLVLDFSSLWAGPLCARLLGLTGMRVIKVESVHRLDGMRRGHAGFYDVLHGGHESVVLDFEAPAERARLLALIGCADVVIEASRPRAFAQLGIDPMRVAASRPGLTWIGITAYGRTGPWADTPGFGDDVAVAAGLFATEDGAPTPCADAIADPLTGVFAAAVATACVRAGGGLLADVAMRDVCLAALAVPHDPRPAYRVGDGCDAHAIGPGVSAPRVPTASAPAPGADTERILAELLGATRSERP